MENKARRTETLFSSIDDSTRVGAPTIVSTWYISCNDSAEDVNCTDAHQLDPTPNVGMFLESYVAVLTTLKWVVTTLSKMGRYSSTTICQYWDNRLIY